MDIKIRCAQGSGLWLRLKKPIYVTWGTFEKKTIVNLNYLSKYEIFTRTMYYTTFT